MEVLSTHCNTLQESRDEMKRRLTNSLTSILSINPDEVHLTEQKLGSGSFAGEQNTY